MDRYWASFTTAQLREELNHAEALLMDAETLDLATVAALEKTERSLQIEIAERDRSGE